MVPNTLIPDFHGKLEKMKTNAFVLFCHLSFIMSRIQHFLDLVNHRLFSGDHLAQLSALWEEAHRYPQCQTLVLKGERQGQVCGKACVKYTPTCMCHAPRPPKKEVVAEHRDRCSQVTKKGHCQHFSVANALCASHQPKERVVCSFVLKSGKRVSVPCGKTCSKTNTLCQRHRKEKVVKPVKEKDVKPVKEKVVKPVKEKVDKMNKIETVTKTEQTEAQRCDWQIKAGANKGQLCGIKCAAEKKKCILHV